MNKFDAVMTEYSEWIIAFGGLLGLSIIILFTFHIVYLVSLVLGWDAGGGLLLIFGFGMCATLILEGLIGIFQDIFREYKEVRQK